MARSGLTLSYRLDGAEKLKKNIDRFNRAFVEATEDLINKVSNQIQLDARKNCPVDTGRLRSSLKTVKRMAGGIMSADVGTNVNYAAFVEFGTAQEGKRTAIAESLPSSYVHGPKHYPPAEALERWVSRKKFAVNSEFTEVEDRAAMLAFHIATRPGLPARPYLWPAFVAARPRWEAGIRQLLTKADRKR